MATGMTFTTLKQDVQRYLERGVTLASDPIVFEQIPRLINLAERRIARELKIQGFINVVTTALAPGQFRTDWAGRSMDRTPRSIPDYDGVMDPIRAARQAKSGHQPGDPDKAAQALLALVAADAPPVRLFLGADALGLVTQKLEAMRDEIATWEPLSRSTGFAAG